MKNKGQVLIESLVLLPTMITLVTMVMFASYVVVVRKWSDYWVYRAALCQTFQDTAPCKKRLFEKLSLLMPQHFYDWEAGWKTQIDSQVIVRLHFLDAFQMRIHSKVLVPRATTVDLLQPSL